MVGDPDGDDCRVRRRDAGAHGRSARRGDRDDLGHRLPRDPDRDDHVDVRRSRRDRVPAASQPTRRSRTSSSLLASTISTRASTGSSSPWLGSRATKASPARHVGAAHRPRLHAAVDRRDRDEERALETIAAAADAGMTVFDTARVRARRTSSATTSGCSPARFARCGADGTRADRDEGRDGAGRRRVGPGRPREGDPRRLRGEPRRARRPADRPLPDPRARSADAVADVGARARPARSTTGSCGASGSRTSTARQLDEALELAPVTAVQVALSPFDDRALRGGSRRALRRGGDRRDRALAARRAAPGGAASPATRRSRRSPRRAARRRRRSRSPGCSSSRRTSSRSRAPDGRRRPARPRAPPRSSSMPADAQTLAARVRPEPRRAGRAPRRRTAPRSCS